MQANERPSESLDWPCKEWRHDGLDTLEWALFVIWAALIMPAFGLGDVVPWIWPAVLVLIGFIILRGFFNRSDRSEP